jgi:hypothetical protein
MTHLAVPAVRGVAPVRAEVETAATPEEMAVAAMGAETPVAVGTAEAMAGVEEGSNGVCSLPE